MTSTRLKIVLNIMLYFASAVLVIIAWQLISKIATYRVEIERSFLEAEVTHLKSALKTRHNYTHKEIKMYENGFQSVDDSDLIQFLQQRWLIYPSEEKLPSSGEEKHYSQAGQSQFIDKFLNRKEKGFFIESGAHNGVYLSNTLFFEQFRGWTGLLVEPDAKAFENIILARLGSYAINACLSLTNQTSKIGLDIQGEYSKISNQHSVKTTVQCFPLYSILTAIGVDTIDYFSLDIEGAELEVLKTIPWEKVRINVLTIEYRAIPGTKDAGRVTTDRLKEFREFFRGLKIYVEVRIIKFPGDGKGIDLVFARKDIL